MRNLTTIDALVLDRQHRFEDAATRYRQSHELPVARRAPFRAGAGWMLVRAGLRLAQIDHLTQASGGTTQAPA
ncbi:MAG: hypothetical protein QOF20_490 [Acidimicrobiaceae bacterium]|jgi:hypothetical protein|nr:hypothetical protein [Acidimicrobiaceae bacterium]MDQ1365095.1 hypothetical protein [Acidimicrobiaceae bacterium]MDQ1368137.1 hypothetical protein [Acidimicrobiaceae bacterium]MDQ1377232.1 hypothetical protein [Acidimicrobiaceae bacterium]MDQ1401637.1 hypothetical protein [Acidimicrobiaceae bacterium]